MINLFFSIKLWYILAYFGQIKYTIKTIKKKNSLQIINYYK